MDTLTYILNKYNLDIREWPKMPIEIPNVGRNILGTWSHELGFKVGVEIGTERGEYAEILLKANPNLVLHCVDPWLVYRGYRDHTRQEKLNSFYEITKQRLGEYEEQKRVYYWKMFSMDAVKEFKDDSLDFVYIDANHDFAHVTEDIYYWSKKVRKGGIIAGHDYIDRRDDAAHVHVKRVLPGYTQSYNISPWFVIGREAKIEGEVRDSSRSWMFIKQ